MNQTLSILCLIIQILTFIVIFSILTGNILSSAKFNFSQKAEWCYFQWYIFFVMLSIIYVLTFFYFYFRLILTFENSYLNLSKIHKKILLTWIIFNAFVGLILTYISIGKPCVGDLRYRGSKNTHVCHFSHPF